MNRLRPLVLILGVVAVVASLAAGDALGRGVSALLLWVGAAAIVIGVAPSGMPRLRGAGSSLLRILAAFCVVFLVLALQLTRMQVSDQDAYARKTGIDPASGEVVSNPRLVTESINANRGTIYDRNQVPLAWTESETGTRTYASEAIAPVTGYFSPSLYGTSGLESSFDEELRGETGGGITGFIRRDLLGDTPAGNDLVLTLDAGLQQSAIDLLDGRTGAVVVIDVQTGAVVALASTPGYDANLLAGTSPTEVEAARAYWGSLVNDPANPLLPRATGGLYTPGSTFKVITASGAIETGVATPETVYIDNGYLEVDGHVIEERNRPDDTVDEWTVREGLWYSLNVVLAQVGLDLGAEQLTAYAERFGFDQEIPFDLPVATSQVASTSTFLDSRPALADTAFGQGELLVSPLQMAMVAQAIANDGAMMSPYLVAEVRNADGAVVERHTPSVWRQAIDPGTAATMQDLMIGVVEDGYGTAAQVPGLVIGGKTGTAEVEGQEPHGWFIGFGGVGEPQYAVAVVLEHGGTGVGEPARIAATMLAAAVESAP